MRPSRKAVSAKTVKYVKQTGGHGQYGHVVIAVEPLEPACGSSSSNKIVGGVIPREYMPAVEEGHRRGPGRRRPWRATRLQDVKVTLLDGSFHEVDSSELAFKIAGSMAFKNAVKKAGPILLEPVMDVEVGHARRIMSGT
ncbi:MAG: hypothetical protein MZU95_15240 [Desulfomicrobium escambiense]|nr:hypothetical protein [Desulfomicrobium escambiense]